MLTEILTFSEVEKCTFRSYQIMFPLNINFIKMIILFDAQRTTAMTF